MYRLCLRILTGYSGYTTFNENYLNVMKGWKSDQLFHCFQDPGLMDLLEYKLFPNSLFSVLSPKLLYVS